MDEVLFSDEQRTNNKYLPVVIGIILIIVLVFGTYMFLMSVIWLELIMSEL